jgi:hypothetical protein
MSETTEPQTHPVTTAPSDPVVVEPEVRRPNRVATAAAWVGIVAGTVFVVAVIFFSGFILGKHSDGGGRSGGGHERGHGMMFDRGFPPGAPMMPMRPGQAVGPGPAGPGNAEPNQPTPPASPERP